MLQLIKKLLIDWLYCDDYCLFDFFSNLFVDFQVIPQLIARIDTPRQLVGRLIHQLLSDIGKHHPQVITILCVCLASLSFYYSFISVPICDRLHPDSKLWNQAYLQTFYLNCKERIRQLSVIPDKKRSRGMVEKKKLEWQ